MITDPAIEPAEEELSADPTLTPPSSEHAAEVSRIAALLRDRFGFER